MILSFVNVKSFFPLAELRPQFFSLIIAISRFFMPPKNVQCITFGVPGQKHYEGLIQGPFRSTKLRSHAIVRNIIDLLLKPKPPNH